MAEKPKFAPGNLPRCSEPLTHSWDRIKATSFSVRSCQNYIKKRIKKHSRPSFYKALSVDVFKTNKKPRHLARFVDFDCFASIDIAASNSISDSLSNNSYASSFSNSSQNSDNDSSLNSAKITSKCTSSSSNKLLKNIQLDRSKSLITKTSSKNSVKNGVKNGKTGLNRPKDENLADLPQFLVISMLIPDYKPNLVSQQKIQGESIIVCSKLDQNQVNVAKAENHPSLTLLKRFMSGNKELLRRLKIIGKLMNIEEVKLPKVLSSLLCKYNGKPFIVKTSTSFFRGKNYFEIDIDIHKFSYMSLSALNSIRPLMPQIVSCFGFVVQAEKDDEMPEQIAACFKLHRIRLDFATDLPKFII